MIRHSLNQFLLQLKHKKEPGFDMAIFGRAIQYLNSLDFHKRLRISFCNFICSDFEKILAVLYRGEPDYTSFSSRRGSGDHALIEILFSSKNHSEKSYAQDKISEGCMITWSLWLFWVHDHPIIKTQLTSPPQFWTIWKFKLI